jgi:hypothetical protein
LNGESNPWEDARIPTNQPENQGGTHER